MMNSELDYRDMWDDDLIEKGGIHDKYWVPAKGFWILKLFKPGVGRTLGRCYTLQIDAGRTYGFWEQHEKLKMQKCFEELNETLPLDIGKDPEAFEKAAHEILMKYL